MECFRRVIEVGTWVLDRVMRGYFGLRVGGLEHLPRSGPALVVGNHPSLIDGLLLYLVAPRSVRFVAHRVLFRHPLLGWLTRGMGFIRANGHGALREALAALDGGDVVVLFPEGEVWDEGRMLELHGGVAVLALRSGAPLVPLGIAGAASAYPLGAWLPRPRPIALCLGPATEWPRRAPEEEVDNLDVMAVLSDCRRRIQAARDRADRLLEGASWSPRRVLRVVLAAGVLLPLVALLTATSPRFRRSPPPREDTGGP